MKSKFLLLLLSCFVLGFAACDDASSKTEDQSAERDSDSADQSTDQQDQAEVLVDTQDELSEISDTAHDITQDNNDLSDTGEDQAEDLLDQADAADITEDASTDWVEPSCSLPQAFDLGVTYSQSLHVATTGSAAGDGSPTSPFATLEQAAAIATPGTEILVHAGTYGGGVFLNGLQGSATQPIAIRSAGDGEVVFDAQGATEVMHLVEPQYVVLEDLTLRNSTGNGLNIDDGGSYESPAEHVVLRSLHVHQVGTGGNNDCIKLSGLDRFTIVDSEIHDCNAGDAIDMVGCHEGLIASNHIHDTPGGGIQAKGGTADILIHGNRFVDVVGRSINAGGSTGLEYFRPIDASYEAARLIMHANTFVRPGEDSGASVAYVGCDACVFTHNTIYMPTTWIARILQERTEERFVPCRDGIFANNIIYFNVSDLRNGTFVNVGANTEPESFIFANNLWFALDQSGFTGPTLSGGIPAESGTIVADPGFSDASNGDFSISASSPAIGAGHPSYLSNEVDGDGRCYLNPPACGAFEGDS